jgi:decaprenylphospho-beta-D-ribofuranose 2-oxidase
LRAFVPKSALKFVHYSDISFLCALRVLCGSRIHHWPLFGLLERMSNTAIKNLAGWGNFPVQECVAARPEKARELKAAIAATDTPDTLARGLGRAYGDAALNDGSGIILTERLNHFLAFDAASGTLTCEGGASFADIIETFLPRGWFLPVTPGTKFVTVGGAIACDVHGKNHHRDGTLATFIDSFDLLTAKGETLHCSREENAPAFWATIGGMGLTGVIARATLRLLQVETAYIAARYRRTANLDATLEEFGGDHNVHYSVAWIDCLASGASLGRSVLIRGEHARLDQLTPEQQAAPFETATKRKKAVPFPFPDFALNPLSVRAFNAAYYAAHPDGEAITGYEPFFYPLDGILKWNNIYGKRGFVQYQLALPFETSRSGLIQVLEKLAASGRPSFLAVLKTFGEANQAPLSFPFAGHTLALDLPNTGADLLEFTRELDEIVLAHEGRVYLAKDATLSPAHFRAMYPRLGEYLEVKRELDPENRFASSLSKRLQLTEETAQ